MHFSIPSQFNLFGQTIKVKYRKTLIKRNKLRGYWNAPKNMIELQLSTKKEPITKEQMEQTFLHEAVHAILDHLGYEELSEDEKLVDQFASLLHQFLKTNES